MENLGSWLTFGSFWVPKVPKIGVLGSLLVTFWEVFGAMVK